MKQSGQSEEYEIQGRRYVDGSTPISSGVKIPTIIPAICNRDPRSWFEFLDDAKSLEGNLAYWRDKNWCHWWAPMTPTQRTLPT